MATTYGPFFGVVRDIHDGDTCGIDLDLGFGVAITTVSFITTKRLLTCRLYGINAPELKVKNASGALVDNPDGIAARDYLTSLIPAGAKVIVISHLWDREGGRYDGEITRAADGLNVNKAMVDSGHAVPYFP